MSLNRADLSLRDLGVRTDAILASRSADVAAEERSGPRPGGGDKLSKSVAKPLYKLPAAALKPQPSRVALNTPTLSSGRQYACVSLAR